MIRVKSKFRTGQTGYKNITSRISNPSRQKSGMMGQMSDEKRNLAIEDPNKRAVKESSSTTSDVSNGNVAQEPRTLIDVR